MTLVDLDTCILIKHKHEAFDVFKVFQNEVKNHLWKKIKAIRSDVVANILVANLTIT